MNDSAARRLGNSALAVMLVLIAAGCHHRAQAGDTLEASGRIVHGIVSVTGTTFEQRIMLETGNGPLRLLASAADSAALVHVQGAEVSVRSTDELNALRVRSFTVTRVGRDSVVDGIVRRDGDRLVIEDSHGRHALGNPPSALWQLVGGRVWIAGPLATGPNSYGIIARP